MLRIIPLGLFGIIFLILLVVFLLTKSRAAGTIFIGFTLLPFAAFLLAWLFNPTVPTRSEIIGDYEIDRSRYPGPNADWQHANYALKITDSEVILTDARSSKVWKSHIDWFDDPAYRWKFLGSRKRHHLLAEGPAIIRDSFSYYYVFRSPLYGDVFFTKK